MDQKPYSIWPRLILVLIFTAGSVSIFVARASMVRSPHDQQALDAVREMTRDGLGREVTLAQPGATPEQSRAAVASVRAFVRERSGLDMGDEIENRLADMEAITLSAHARRISPDELTDLLTQSLLERVRRLKDDEITRAARLMGCQDCEQLEALPDDVLVMLRASGEATVSARVAIETIKRFRDHTVITPALLPMVTLARTGVAVQVNRRLMAFSHSLPEQWDRVESAGLTPLEAYLVAYSVAADDPLWYSQSNLQRVMLHIEQLHQPAIESSDRLHSPSPSLNSRLGQRRAYGDNGYIFPTPLSLIMDKETTTRLLDQIEERSRL